MKQHGGVLTVILALTAAAGGGSSQPRKAEFVTENGRLKTEN